MIFFSCTDEESLEDIVPRIRCIGHEEVSSWIQDTLVTGYKFSYPSYLIKQDNKGINVKYLDEEIPNQIILKFGTCGGPFDPCVPEPYNSSYSISPPTADTIELRSLEAIKYIEVCNNDVLHGVLYILVHNEEFNVLNGMFFTLITEEDTYYLGGDFIFNGDYLDDVIKICKSFVPL